MTHRIFLFFLFLVLSAPNASAQPRQRSVTDHHVHILSPSLISLWKSMGIPFSKPDQAYSEIDSIVRRVGTDRMRLIAMGYVFTSEEFGGSIDSADLRLQRENDFLAAAKKRYPDNISAFYGIDPLRNDAIAEIERCRTQLKLDGIKMHFNASQVYLTVPAHREKVRRMFEYASHHSIPVLLHFDNSHRKFGRRDVMILADSVLHGLSFVDLQIAHFGTSGGFTRRTAEVMDTFAELFTAGHPVSSHRITFDISAVAMGKAGDGVPASTEEEFLALAGACRKIGFDRIVFGTDYPLYTVDEYLEILRKKLHLTKDEVDQLLNSPQ